MLIYILKMTLNFTTAKDLIENKIERNIILMDIMKIEIKIYKLEMVIRLRLCTHNETNIKFIEEINKIESQQINEYSALRAERVAELTNTVNENKVELESLVKEIFDYRNQCFELVKKVNELNVKILDMTYVTNFKIIQNDDSCSKAARFS